MRLLRHVFFPCILSWSLVTGVALASGAASPRTDLGPAPEFSLVTLDGDRITHSSVAGKVVVLNFWATWCPDCAVALPDYLALQNSFREAKDFVFVGVSLDKSPPEDVRRFAQKNHINYPIAMGNDTLAGMFGGIGEIPTTTIIDRDGTIRFRQAGSVGYEGLRRIVQSLL